MVRPIHFVQFSGLGGGDHRNLIKSPMKTVKRWKKFSILLCKIESFPILGGGVPPPPPFAPALRPIHFVAMVILSIELNHSDCSIEKTFQLRTDSLICIMRRAEESNRKHKLIERGDFDRIDFSSNNRERRRGREVSQSSSTSFLKTAFSSNNNLRIENAYIDSKSNNYWSTDENIRRNNVCGTHTWHL